MTAHKYVVATARDSLLAKDRLINTLCFNHTAPGAIVPTDLQSLADDLAGVWLSKVVGPPAGNPQVDVWVYAYGAPPQEPLAHVVRNPGNAPPSENPREVALCLSFYGTSNSPRHRGRVYLPAGICFTTPGLRPTTANLTAVMAVGDALGALGGVDVDWSVHSPTAGTTEKVEHYWCDDEWDTVRSRGLKATTRQQAATAE